MKIAVYVTVIFLISLPEKSESRHSLRIIGGEPVTEGEWPWLVSLQWKKAAWKLFGFIPMDISYRYCGGSVINDRWILTAAHCFDGGYSYTRTSYWEARLAAVTIKYGRHQLAEDVIIAEYIKYIGYKHCARIDPNRIKDLLGRIFGLQDWQQWNIGAERIEVHPDYNEAEKWENDVAVLKLRRPVPSGRNFDRIRRIQLPPANNITFPELFAVCAMKGWGCTANGRSQSRIAMSVELPIFDPYICGLYFGAKFITNRICAGFLNNGRGICPGDSGGPLTCKNNAGEWIQVGIASYGRRENTGDYPGVFARVSHYVDWINSVLRT